MSEDYYEHPNRRHGQFGTRTYNIWGKMIQRCLNPKSSNYQHYGGRGILVCERWLDFENFYADMGKAPASLSLDRIDNEKGYSPDNCRWATGKEQCRNTRRNCHLTLNGTTKTVIEWAEYLGVSPKTLYTRKASGWTDERTLTQPIRRVSAAWRHS